MLKQDFILRMIETLIGALARARKKQDESNPTDALGELEPLYQSLLGLDPTLVHTLNTSALQALLRHPSEFHLLAALFAEEATLHDALHQPTRARQRAQRALDLFSAGLQQGASINPALHHFIPPLLARTDINVTRETRRLWERLQAED